MHAIHITFVYEENRKIIMIMAKMMMTMMMQLLNKEAEEEDIFVSSGCKSHLSCVAVVSNYAKNESLHCRGVRTGCLHSFSPLFYLNS